MYFDKGMRSCPRASCKNIKYWYVAEVVKADGDSINGIYGAYKTRVAIAGSDVIKNVIGLTSKT